MQDNKVVRFLTEKPKRDAAEDAGFEERFNKNIGPKFREVDADIAASGHSEYLLKGGRGSLKSSFISMMIVKLLREEPRGSALVLRKVAPRCGTRCSRRSSGRWTRWAHGASFQLP